MQTKGSTQSAVKTSYSPLDLLNRFQNRRLSKKSVLIQLQANTREDRYKDAIREAGWIEQFITLLSDEDNEVVMRSLNVIADVMFANSRNQAIIMDAMQQREQLFLELWNRDNILIQVSMLTIVVYLVKNTGTSSPTLKIELNKYISQEREIMIDCSEGLNTGNQTALGRLGIVNLLVTRLRKSKSPFQSIILLTLIYLATNNEANKNLICDTQIFRYLKKFFCK